MPFDFAQKLDKLDGVPAEFKGLYVSVEGGTGFQFHPDFQTHISGLTTALDKERKSNKTASDALKQFKTIGETPEAISTKIQELTEAATAAKDGKANWDKMKADLEKGHATELTKRDEAVAGMRRSLERYLIDAEATTAITEAKGSAVLLLPHVRSQVKVIEQDGNYVVRVVDGDGDPRGDGKGGFMSIKDLVSEMRQSEQFGRAFEPSGASGSGKQPGSSKTGAKGTDGSNLSPTEKIAAGLRQLKR